MNAARFMGVGQVVAFTVLLALGSGQAIACAPPAYPPDHVFPTPAELVLRDYRDAELVVLLHVDRIEKTTGVKDGAGNTIEVAHVTPVQVFKGPAERVPRSLKIQYNDPPSNTCDSLYKPRSAQEGKDSLLFFARDGSVIRHDWAEPLVGQYDALTQVRALAKSRKR